MWLNKIAVVTGASAGIGAAIVKDFISAGINVVRLDKSLTSLKQNLERSHGKVYSFKCYVSDQKSVKETFKLIEKELGTVNILVNNAGVGRNANILDEGEEAGLKLKEVINTNIFGLVECTREAFRLMKKSDDYGFIININSVLGHSIPFMGFSRNMYPPSKFASRAITEVLRQELIYMNNHKIRVSNLSPGSVETQFRNAAGYPQHKSNCNCPNSLPLTPEDVSNAVMYLLSTPYSVNITELIIKPVGEQF